MNEKFKKMEALGVTALEAREYCKYLEKKATYQNVKNHKVRGCMPTPLDVAYLTDGRTHIECVPYLDVDRADAVWGVRIGDVIWCRVHTAEMLVPQDIRNYFEVHGEFDACLLREDSNGYFYALTGFNHLVISVPRHEDLRTAEKYANEFAEVMQIFRENGIVAEDWKAEFKYLDDAGVFHLSDKPQHLVCRPIHRVASRDII